MDKRAEVAKAFGGLFKETARAYFKARVVSVEGKTCTIDYDGLHLTDVRLTPTTTERQDTIEITPAKDSYVLVASLSGDLTNLEVIRADAVESVRIAIGDTVIFADKKGVILNGGKLGGMVKVGELVTKINTIERQLNSLKMVFMGWTPSVSPDSGAALKAGVAAWAGESITPTTEKELANDKVKQ